MMETFMIMTPQTLHLALVGLARQFPLQAREPILNWLGWEKRDLMCLSTKSWSCFHLQESLQKQKG